MYAVAWTLFILSLILGVVVGCNSSDDSSKGFEGLEKVAVAGLSVISGKPSIAFEVLSEEGDKKVRGTYSLDPFGYYPKVSVCRKLIVNGKTATCRLKDSITLNVILDSSTPIEVVNPNEVVSFVLPELGFTCYDYGSFKDCVKHRFNQKYLVSLFKFKELEKRGFPDWEKLPLSERKEIEKIARLKAQRVEEIVDSLNLALEENRIKVFCTNRNGQVCFTVNVPKEYLKLLEEYTKLLGTPAVIGIKVAIPALGERTYYYDLGW